MNTDNPKQLIRTCHLCNCPPAWVLPIFLPHSQNPSELKNGAPGQQWWLLVHVKPLKDGHYTVIFCLAEGLLHSSSEAKSLLLFPSTESSQSGTRNGSGRPGQALEGEHTMHHLSWKCRKGISMRGIMTIS